MTTDYIEIEELLDHFDPSDYARTRNYADGAVSRLSPYISRGVLSTRQVAKHLISKGYGIDPYEKFYQELAWRDYWQRIWVDHPERLLQEEAYFNSLEHTGLSAEIINAETQISGIDDGIRSLYKTGYVHNHIRMYIASLHCNIAHRDWLSGAKWMYYHLLDADWASNALSWKWTAGQFNGKVYFANQDNVNKFCHTNDHNTYIDRSYEDLRTLDTPNGLQPSVDLELKTILPDSSEISLDANKPTALYTIYNLDKHWRETENLNRVLILEPSHFEAYPVSDKMINFVLGLARNIDGIKVYTGEFSSLVEECPDMQFIYKEHPFSKHFTGLEDDRDWLNKEAKVTGSFFKYWKQVRKNLKQEFENQSKYRLVKA